MPPELQALLNEEPINTGSNDNTSPQRHQRCSYIGRPGVCSAGYFG